MACILFFLLGMIAIGASVCKSPVYPSPYLNPVPFAKNYGYGDNVFGGAFGNLKKGENRLAAGRYNPEIPESCRHSTFCEDVPNYPQEEVDELISRLGNSANFQLERLYKPDIDQRLSLEDDMPLCSSEEKVVHPKVAQGRDGRWYNLVNRKNNPVQGYRVQECDFSRGTKCSDIVVFPPHYNSTCVQKYIYRKVTAFDKSNDNLRAFEQEVKIPSCCSCVATVLFEY